MLPLWLLLLFPQLWGISLLLSFVADVVVLSAAMKYYGVTNVRRNVAQSILKVWISGLAADLAGMLLLLAGVVLPMWATGYGQTESWWVTEVCEPMMNNPLESLPAFLYMTLCVGVTMTAIYLLDSKWALHKLVADDRQRGSISRTMAVFTAPYLFYLPTAWWS